MSVEPQRVQREAIRAMAPAIELRSNGDVGGPVMTGHFAVFNQWTEINSVWEGRFLERFAQGSFKKTMSERRDKMRVLFQHGMDPQVGDKPLGPIERLEEDGDGAAYDVPLLDASYVRDLVLPGLKANLYGASFRFKVMREELNEEPGVSDYNPNGLPERTVKEAQVMEFGPVTFPAYAGASAGVRSLTDEFLQRALTRDPEALRAILRMDSEDAGTLAQMVSLASMYIEEQDEPDEQPNIAKMEAIQVSLVDLLNFEANEQEPEEELLSDAPSGEIPERRVAPQGKQDVTPRTTPRPRLTSSKGNSNTLTPQKGWKLK